MSKKMLEQSKRDFCCIYLDTLDANRAAERSGGENGYELLHQKEVQRYLEQARKNARETIQMEDVIRRLCQIAFSRPNDAIALACGRQYHDIEDLDLAAVSEFKCKEEAYEVKFLDRIRALQVLGELLGRKEEDRDSTAKDFFQALEKTAMAESGDAFL